MNSSRHDAPPRAKKAYPTGRGRRAPGALFLLAAALAAATGTSLTVPATVAGQERPGQEREVTTLEQLLGLEGVEPMELTLDEALGTALRQNRDIREARLRVEEAEGRVTEAWGGVFPRVELNASWTRNISPPVSFLPALFFDPDAPPDRLIPVAFGLDNAWSTTISVEQPLFEAQAFIGVGAAGRFQALQDEEFRGRTHEVVTGVRTSYYQLLLAEEQARLLERSLSRVLESLRETRALAREGLASDYDVLRLEVELANLEPQLRRAANEALRVERELVTQLDLPEGTRLRVQGSLAEMDLDRPEENTGPNRRILAVTGVDLPREPDPVLIDQLVQRARVSSSPVQQAGLNQELRRAELRAEQSEFLPRLSLFGNYQVQAQQDGSPDFFGGQRGYGRLVGVQLTLPIFTGRQRLARVDQRQAALRMAELQTEMTLDRVRDEMKTVLDQIDEARHRTRGQRLAVQQATRGFEIASAQYREGLSTQLELTDAEVALRQSEFNYAEAVYDYLQARARLDELVGDVPVPTFR